MIEPQESAVEREQPSPLRGFAHDAMACTFEVLLAEENAKYAGQAARAAFAEVDRIERELSRFIPTSDIARINALKPGERLHIGIEVIQCLQLAARIYDETNGAFDVTFGSRREADRGLTPPLMLDAKSRRVGVRNGGVVVDLGGVGKGYAVDRMVTILRDWSVDAGLVHCGQSTVFALGRPAGAEGWSIAIRDPVPSPAVSSPVSSDRCGQPRPTAASGWCGQPHPTAALGAVRITDVALSGSGRKLHGDHIFDPRSGRPATDKLGAWALAPSAALADALSTAFMVMTPAEVAAYCRNHAAVSALLLLERGGQREVVRFGPGFAPRDEQRGD
jgi:thiamine biosynthesis lipoprotein